MNVATTRGALLRGVSSKDALGDEIEDNTAIVAKWGDFPLSIIERDSSEFDQASQTWRSVKKLTGRAAGTLPVDEGDRIKDLRDGVIYAVDSIRVTKRGLAGRSSVTMKLRRTAP